MTSVTCKLKVTEAILVNLSLKPFVRTTCSDTPLESFIMKTVGLLTLILLSNLTQNASAQAVAANDKKPAVVADAEIKRGPLADFYELVAQHPVSATSAANTASKIKIAPQDAKPILAQQSSQTAATKPASD